MAGCWLEAKTKDHAKREQTRDRDLVPVQSRRVGWVGGSKRCLDESQRDESKHNEPAAVLFFVGLPVSTDGKQDERAARAHLECREPKSRHSSL